MQDSEIVYRSVHLREGDVLTLLEEEGAMSLAASQRAARPKSYASEPFTYEQRFSTQAQSDGSVLEAYAVMRVENPVPGGRDPSEEQAPIRIAPEVAALIERADAGDIVRVRLVTNLRGFPEWDVPLLPSFPLPAEDLLEAA